MAYLIFSGVVALVFGFLLFFVPGTTKKLFQILNHILFVLDEKLDPAKLWIGILLLAVAGWMIYLVIRYPELYHLHPTWIIALIFGILFILLPEWLGWLSNVMDRVVFSTDEFVEAFARGIGMVLILAGVYILYMVYAFR